MEIKRYEGNGRMSKAVVAGGVIYLCGQTSRDGGDVRMQAQAVLEKIDGLLAAYGSDRKHLLMVQAFLKDMADFSPFNEVYDAWVPDGCEPARACVQATMAAPEILVELVAIAAKKEG